MPLDDLPQWMQAVSTINPVHYGVDAIRQIYIDDPAQVAPFVFKPVASIAVEGGIIAAAGAVFTAAAVWQFNREA